MLSRIPAPVAERTPSHLLLLRWVAYPVFLALQRMYGTELFRDDWRRTDREHQRRLELREQERQARHLAAEETKRERERRRAAKTAAREAAVQTAEAARKGAEADKARRQEAKIRDKAARARQRGRAAMRARIRHTAKGWLSRCWPGRAGQST